MREHFENGLDWAFEEHHDETAFIHESSYVDSPCHIGKNTEVMHFTHVMPHTIIGDDCHIGHNVTIASGVMIGNAVRVMNNSLLNSGVILEDAVFCGPSTIFSPISRLRGKIKNLSQISPTLVRTGANIGANSSVAAGVTIGRHTFIEAGTVVDENIPDYALIAGNPSKVKGWRCECGEILSFNKELTDCPACPRVYRRKSELKVVQLKGKIA